MTKNITRAIDEAVLDRVRIIAAERKTTGNGLVRDYLETLSSVDDRRACLSKPLDELRAKSKLEVGPVTWTRDDLYER
jgi:hypothetical protein